MDRTRPASLTDDTSEGASWSYGYAETATHTSCGGAAAPASSPPAQSARARQPAAARPEPYVQTKSDASGHARGGDPWAVTVSLLEELADGTCGSDDASVAPEQPSNRVPARVLQQHAGDDSAQTPASSQPRDRDAVNAVVTFVERVGAKTVSITWRDSTACHYSEQLWIRRIARTRGLCAMTGARISRGDAVYGPSTRLSRRPSNVSAMILAASLDEMD